MSSGDSLYYNHIFKSYIKGENISGLVYVAVIVFTAFFDALSYMIRWYLDMEKADIINRKIGKSR